MSLRFVRDPPIRNDFRRGSPGSLRTQRSAIRHDSVEQDLRARRAREPADRDLDVVRGSPPGARCRFSCAQVSTLERVRSQVTGSLLVTVVPAVSVAIMLLGFSWQSVERHHTSAPLEMVKDWVVDPTSIVQSFVPLFVSEIESFGSTPAAYVSASVTAATSMSAASQGATAGVCSADGSGVGDSPSAVELEEGEGDVDGVGDGVDAVPAAAHGRAIRSHAPMPMAATASTSAIRTTSRRRRYTAAEGRGMSPG